MLAKDSASVHTSNRTINWPMTGGVHLFAGRVMGLSLVDNSTTARVRTCTCARTHSCTKRKAGLNQSRKHIVDSGAQLEQQRLCTPPSPHSFSHLPLALWPNCFGSHFFHFLYHNAHVHRKNLSAWIPTVCVQLLLLLYLSVCRLIM